MDVWAIGVHSFQARRFDAMLEMHPDVLTGEKWDKAPDGEAYRAWLRTNTTQPVYMHKPLNEIPASQKYPLAEITEKYCGRMWLGRKQVRNFFGGTASYALALALYQDYKRIEIYGIELSSRPDYDDERDCFFTWVGKAEMLGVDVVAHENSRLFRELLYKGK